MTAENKVISGAVWDAFCDALKATGREVLENSADDGLERAEGFRYLGRLTAWGLRSALEPAPLSPPLIRYEAPRIGADNPDFLYGTCPVRGDLVYRIRGRRNDAYNFNIGAYHGQLGTAEGLQCSGFLAASDLETGGDGSFEIIAGREPRDGNWLELCEASNQFIVRQTILTPGRDRPAELEVEILEGDPSAPFQPLSAEQLDHRLGSTAAMLQGVVRQFLGWTNDFRQRPNEIHPIRPELQGMAKGDPNTQYSYGYFDIAEDEALVVTLRPPECEYWNIQLANHWLESLDAPNTPSSINLASAVPDEDGSVPVVISLRDPGRPNWLDTQGHRRGAIALRWVGAPPQPRPPVTRCRLSDLRR